MCQAKISCQARGEVVEFAIMENSIVAVGSIALDTIKTPHAEVRDIPGGSAVYFGWAASYFSKVGIVGTAGNDFPGEYLELLKSRSINLDGLKVGGKTFRWTGRYGENPDERETLSVCQDVFENYEPEFPESYRSSSCIFLANIDPDLHLKVLSQIKNPGLVTGDTMDLWIATKKDSLLETLKKIDMMFLNESEARQLTNENNLIKAARVILSFGPKTVIIKKGENGVFVLSENILFSMPAYPCELVCDPTGAGDVFAGAALGFLASESQAMPVRAGRVNEASLRKAVAYGSVVASFCVEDFGLRKLEKVTEDDIMGRVEKFRRLTQF